MNQTRRNVKAQRPCRCLRSKCLKLYCGCFSFEVYCDGCNCMNCQNNFENDDTRNEAMAIILDRRAGPFRTKIAAICQRNSQVSECSLESVRMEQAGEKRRRDECNDPDREKRRKMMRMMKEKRGCHVPEEILRQIMLKVPVKSLIRFRFASKRLWDLISDKQFIAEHIVTFEPSASSVQWRSPVRSRSP